MFHFYIFLLLQEQLEVLLLFGNLSQLFDMHLLMQNFLVLIYLPIYRSSILLPSNLWILQELVQIKNLVQDLNFSNKEYHFYMDQYKQFYQQLQEENPLVSNHLLDLDISNDQLQNIHFLSFQPFFQKTSNGFYLLFGTYLNFFFSRPKDCLRVSKVPPI